MAETPRATVYPVLPLRDIVVFPHMIVPLFVGREKSVRALEDVMKDDKQILLVAQKDAAIAHWCSQVSAHGDTQWGYVRVNQDWWNAHPPTTQAVVLRMRNCE